MRVLAASDKFRGTATAHQACAAIGHACWELDIDCTEIPLADGGEGTLEIFGGPNRTTVVTGPLGAPVEAAWRFHRGTAIIEMARASGLALVGGAAGNNAVDATTRGTGELIDTALNMGAKKIIVCLGGSATTDGGLGAVQAISTPARLRAIEFLVACDVDTVFTDAARVFAPQKGASPAQVELLTGRLERLAQRYRDEHGIDICDLAGSGAAGGLGGGLAALGARLLPGFDLVAEETGFADALETCDLVITGEGMLDDTSFDGKVVGSVVSWCTELGVPVAAIVGSVDPEMDMDQCHGIDIVDLTSRVGADEARTNVLRHIEAAARDLVMARR